MAPVQGHTVETHRRCSVCIIRLAPMLLNPLITNRNRRAVVSRESNLRFMAGSFAWRNCLSVTTLQGQFCQNLRWCEACGSQTLPHDGQGPPFAHRKIPNLDNCLSRA